MSHSTVVDFVNEFEEDDDLITLWAVPGATVNFCQWTENYIYNNQVILDLVECLPYNQNRKYMPWLNVRAHFHAQYQISNTY